MSRQKYTLIPKEAARILVESYVDKYVVENASRLRNSSEYPEKEMIDRLHAGIGLASVFKHPEKLQRIKIEGEVLDVVRRFAEKYLRNDLNTPLRDQVGICERRHNVQHVLDEVLEVCRLHNLRNDLLANQQRAKEIFKERYEFAAAFREDDVMQLLTILIRAQVTMHRSLSLETYGFVRKWFQGTDYQQMIFPGMTAGEMFIILDIFLEQDYNRDKRLGLFAPFRFL